MGFFSGSKKTTTIPATGFYSQPGKYQNIYHDLLSNIDNILLPDGNVNSELFRPLEQTEYETTALEAIGKGFTPDKDTLREDIRMQMNPFDSFVIDDISREAAGGHSIFKSALSEAGQFGSNRHILGANDIENTRLNLIGKFKQDQFNNAIENSLNELSTGRRNDAAAQMGAGGFLRGLDTAEKQAPLNALLAAQNSFNGIPTSFGEFGSPQQTITTKSGGGFGGFLSSIAPIVGTAIGGPVGGAIGGAIGGGLNGGGWQGALQGGLSSAFSNGFGGAGGFGLSTGGQSFFNGGARNALNANLGYYGPGF